MIGDITNRISSRLSFRGAGGGDVMDECAAANLERSTPNDNPVARCPDSFARTNRRAGQSANQ